MKTCGELYRDVVEQTAHIECDKLSLGFLIGQAEKVNIGACEGCMTKDIGLATAAPIIAQIYGLKWCALFSTTVNVRSPELWLYRGEFLPWVKQNYPLDSPEWNLHRAAMCGVPANQINLSYHDLKGK